MEKPRLFLVPRLFLCGKDCGIRGMVGRNFCEVALWGRGMAWPHVVARCAPTWGYPTVAREVGAASPWAGPTIDTGVFSVQSIFQIEAFCGNRDRALPVGITRLNMKDSLSGIAALRGDCGIGFFSLNSRVKQIGS